MQKKGISQEGLKLIACVTMLLDHIGAAVVYQLYLNACMVDGIDMLGAAMPTAAMTLSNLYLVLRIVGRVAFPIYCFLLAEGSFYTRRPWKYGLRLAIGAVLSELPFDLALAGAPTWSMQSVMLTLLMGFFMLEVMKRCPNLVLKLIAAIPFALLAEWMCTDYGGMGVALIAVFGICRELPHGKILRLLGVAAVLYLMPSASVQITRYFRLSIEMFALLALIPIHFYSGRKATASKAVQWGFYLFYPVHLAVLYLIVTLL